MSAWTLAIDFGTSGTLAAGSVGGATPDVIELDGSRAMPSVVFIDDSGEVIVGKAADALAAGAPDRAIRAPKRRLADPAPVVVAGRAFPATALVGAVLRHVVAGTTAYQGSAPSEIRLTHPAMWGRPQIARLAEAAALAGITAPKFVPEPVGAAIAYAIGGGITEGGYVAVHDLGGGTFDTAILRAEPSLVPGTPGAFSIVGRPAGDPNLGGELFDELIAQHLIEGLDASIADELAVSDDPMWKRAAANLLTEARRAKEALSLHPYADVLLTLPNGLVQRRLTRSEVDTIVDPYLHESMDRLLGLVDDAGLRPDQLSAVFLLGGASRMPRVMELVQQTMGSVPVVRKGDPKSAVAVGAAHPSADRSFSSFESRPGSTEFRNGATDPGVVAAPGSPTPAEAGSLPGWQPVGAGPTAVGPRPVPAAPAAPAAPVPTAPARAPAPPPPNTAAAPPPGYSSPSRQAGPGAPAYTGPATVSPGGNYGAPTGPAAPQWGAPTSPQPLVSPAKKSKGPLIGVGLLVGLLAIAGAAFALTRGRDDVVSPETVAETVADTSGDTVADTSGDTVADTSGDTVADTSGDTVADTSGDTGASDTTCDIEDLGTGETVTVDKSSEWTNSIGDSYIVDDDCTLTPIGTATTDDTTGDSTGDTSSGSRDVSAVAASIQEEIEKAAIENDSDARLNDPTAECVGTSVADLDSSMLGGLLDGSAEATPETTRAILEALIDCGSFGTFFSAYAPGGLQATSVDCLDGWAVENREDLIDAIIKSQAGDESGSAAIGVGLLSCVSAEEIERIGSAS